MEWILLILCCLQIIDLVIGQGSCGCDYCLDAASFSDGTLRIQEPGKYCLEEDIEFNPNPGSVMEPNIPFQSWWPTDSVSYPGCMDLSGGAYALGYFAAVTIETNDVEFDMQNYEIKMDETFYIQQRFFTIFEIGISPFITGEGVTDFGINDEIISNVYIHDGIIGLSAQSGIHANNAQNVTIENLRIYNFETAGIHFNGFDTLTLNNLIIGPSSQYVKPSGYYTNARLLSYALYEMRNDSQNITFSGERELIVSDIYDNLITALDIAYRSFFDMNTEDDYDNVLYNESIALFTNPSELPDGSEVSGIVLNSLDSDSYSQNVKMTNIKIQDLTINSNEVPAVYFDECSSDSNGSITVLQGPFSDILDIRQMVGSIYNAEVIDLGDDFSELEYIGNVLSDAQITWHLMTSSDGLNAEFLQWALNSYGGSSSDGLPDCTQFVCNGDLMFDANKGIMAMRLYFIEDVFIENIVIKRLINKSPLNSYRCSNSSIRAHDGWIGNNQQEYDDGFATDTKGISVCGGDLVFDGFNNVIEKLVSYNGGVYGLDVKPDTMISFDYVYSDLVPQTDTDSDTEDDRAAIHIQQLCPGHEITFALLAEMLVDKQYPYPNNFKACNIFFDQQETSDISIQPYPPNGIDKVWCADYVPDNKHDVIANLLAVDLDIIELEQETNTTTSNDTYSAYSMKNLADNNDMKFNDDMHVLEKYPNIPYLYFGIGLICIIMVVFVLVTFLMKCGALIVHQNEKNKYKKAKYLDTDEDSDVTEDEV